MVGLVVWARAVVCRAGLWWSAWFPSGWAWGVAEWCSGGRGGSAGRNVGGVFLAGSFGGVECRVGVEFASAGDRNRVSDRDLKSGGRSGGWFGG